MPAAGKLVALLTGASSGIGYAVAEHFAGRGYRIVLVSRKPEAAAAALAQRFSAEILPVAANIGMQLTVRLSPQFHCGGMGSRRR
jgi:NAD(P)-dependent dehydrogenase (short-subunit alcohol dehydrogenase family)